MSALEDLIAETTEELRLDLDSDCVGVWQAFASLRDGREDWNDEELSRAVAQVLTHLVADGAVFGDLDPRSGLFIPWSDQAGAVRRASQEWRRAGRDPDPGEIAWLQRPAPGSDPSDHPRPTELQSNPTTDSLTDVDALIAKVADELRSGLKRSSLPVSHIFVGLWRAKSAWSQEEIWKAAEEVLSRLVAEGAVVEEYDSAAGGFVPWPDQSRSVERASQAWRSLGRDPRVREIGALRMPMEDTTSARR